MLPYVTRSHKLTILVNNSVYLCLLLLFNCVVLAKNTVSLRIITYGKDANNLLNSSISISYNEETNLFNIGRGGSPYDRMR
jgi:hypothetical protein